ncbi:MAG TPA: hypothetical protein ENF87_02060 [Thermoproteales archaeon]|nr:hypothetical protein [Thermoproteales archaeon]
MSFSRKARRRLKYYIIWTPLWILIILVLSTLNILFIFVIQIAFLIKDILDILSKRDLAPEYFEHLPYSLGVAALLGTINPLLLLLSLLDAVIDAYEDLFMEK